MENITKRKALVLAEWYLREPKRRFVVYNIRRRDYILHDFYRFYYRFSRREAIWNSPVINIEDLPSFNTAEELAGYIYEAVNEVYTATVNGELWQEFTKEDCLDMLNYYINGKCYLAYYDKYLGRVCLIKERDKTYDFVELVGSRYFYIDDLHDVIKNKLGLDHDDLEQMMIDINSSYAPLSEIHYSDTVNEALHPYLAKRIDEIRAYIAKKK